MRPPTAQQERQARLDEEFEQAEAMPPVDESPLTSEADYTAALASGEALVFEPEPEDDEEEERRRVRDAPPTSTKASRSTTPIGSTSV